MEKQRTSHQNAALHLFFKQLAELLNESGLDMRKTLKPDIDIPWTERNIKEFIWRPVQMAVLDKESTKELTTKDIDVVFDTIARHLASKHGLVVDFPSIETLINQQRVRRGG